MARVVVAGVAVVIVALGFVHTPWGRAWLRARIASAGIELATLDGSVLGTLRATGVVVKTGAATISAREVRCEVALWPLLVGRVAIDSAEIDDARVVIEDGGGGGGGASGDGTVVVAPRVAVRGADVVWHGRVLHVRSASGAVVFDGALRATVWANAALAGAHIDAFAMWDADAVHGVARVDDVVIAAHGFAASRGEATASMPRGRLRDEVVAAIAATPAGFEIVARAGARALRGTWSMGRGVAQLRGLDAAELSAGAMTGALRAEAQVVRAGDGVDVVAMVAPAAMASSSTCAIEGATAREIARHAPWTACAVGHLGAQVSGRVALHASSAAWQGQRATGAWWALADVRGDDVAATLWAPAMASDGVVAEAIEGAVQLRARTLETLVIETGAVRRGDALLGRGRVSVARGVDGYATQVAARAMELQLASAAIVRDGVAHLATTEVVLPDGERWRGEGGTIALGDAVALRALALQAGAARVELEATWRDAALTAHAAVRGAALARLAPGWRGGVDGAIDVGYRAGAWQLDARFDGAGLGVGAMRDATAQLRARLRAGRFAIDAHAVDARSELAVAIAGDAPRAPTSIAAWRALPVEAIDAAQVTARGVALAAIDPRLPAVSVDGSADLAPRARRGAWTLRGAIAGELAVTPRADAIALVGAARIPDGPEAALDVELALPARPLAAWPRDVVRSARATIARFEIEPSRVARWLPQLRAPIAVALDVTADARGTRATGALRAGGALGDFNASLALPIAGWLADARAAWTSPIAARYRLASAEAARVLALVGRRDLVGGELSARASLDGTLAAPVIEATIEARGLAVDPGIEGRARQPLDSLVLAAAWREGQGTLRIDGRDGDGALAIALTGDAWAHARGTAMARGLELASIAALLPGQLASASGTLDAQLALDAGALTGRVRVARGSLWLAPMLGTLRDATLEVDSTHGELRAQLRGAVDGGTLSMTARAPSTLSTVHVDAAVHRLALRIAQRPIVDAQIAGTLQRRAGVVTGALAVRDARVTLPQQTGRALLDTEMPSDLIIAAPAEAKMAARDASPPSSAPASGLSLDRAELAVAPAAGISRGRAEREVAPASGSSLGRAERSVAPASGISLGRAELEGVPTSGISLGRAELEGVPTSGISLGRAERSVASASGISFGRAELEVALAPVRVVARTALPALDVVHVDATLTSDAPLRVVIDRGVAVRGALELANNSAVELVGRRYTLDGALTFRDDVDPWISVHVRHAFPALELTAVASGPLSALGAPGSIALVDVPGYTQAQLLGYFLGGDPSGDPRAQTSEAFQGALFSGATSALGRRLSQWVVPQLRLERFHCTLGTTTTSPACTIGRQLSERMSLDYTPRLAPRVDENANELQLQYRLTARALIETSGGDRGHYGTDLVWRRRW